MKTKTITRNYPIPATILACLAFIFICGPLCAERVKVLIIDGFHNHDWARTTAKLIEILEADGGFEIDVATVPEQGAEDLSKWYPGMTGYDVVLQNCNSLGKRGDWPEAVKRDLEQFVSGGGGLYVHHGANNSFAEWPQYNDMIGLGWRNKEFGPAITIVDGKVKRIPAGQGDNTRHGPRIDAQVIRKGNHPIHQNLPESWRAADIEVYRYARGPAKRLNVLSYAQDPETGMYFPIEWTVLYGEGRVFNSTYGHYMAKQEPDPPGMQCAAFQTIFVRAMYWVARQPVPAKRPEDFPGADAVSVRLPGHSP